MHSSFPFKIPFFMSNEIDFSAMISQILGVYNNDATTPPTGVSYFFIWMTPYCALLWAKLCAAFEGTEQIDKEKNQQIMSYSICIV